MTLRKRVEPGINCADCAVGLASGLGRGSFCPFVDRQRQAGELLYVEGDTAEHVWFVKRGTVVLYREAGDGQAEGRARAVRFPGSFVGLEALVSSCYIDTARAESDVVICGATREGMDAWLGPRGTPARTALELSLRTACNDLLRRAAPDGNAVKRVAGWLYDEGPRGSMLMLPRRVVADLLGMRPETLSRALAELTKRGALRSTRTTLQIVNDEELAVAAGYDDGSELVGTSKTGTDA